MRFNVYSFSKSYIPYFYEIDVWFRNKMLLRIKKKYLKIKSTEK